MTETIKGCGLFGGELSMIKQKCVRTYEVNYSRHYNNPCTEANCTELKRDIDNLSEERPCPCKALEMDDNACDGSDKFSDEEV